MDSVYFKCGENVTVLFFRLVQMLPHTDNRNISTWEDWT